MSKAAPVSIEVLMTPRAANLTDLDPLLSDRGALVRFVEMGQRLGEPDILILPGTRSAMLDFQAIKRAGYVNTIRALAKKKTFVFGIGGGFQMMGAKIIDIKGSESMFSQSEGFGFFGIATRIMPSMVESTVSFEPMPGTVFCDAAPGPMKGFERHLGRTRYLNGSRPLFRITGRGGVAVDVPDGAVNEEMNAAGTYIHGIFDNEGFRKIFLGSSLRGEQ